MSLSKPESDVGSSVSERTPLVCTEVMLPKSVDDVICLDHYVFVMRWHVSNFKTQRLKRDLINVLSVCMRHGAPALNLLDVTPLGDYTGYAIYYDRERVWLVARMRNRIKHMLNRIITTAIGLYDDGDYFSPRVLNWELVPIPVKVHLDMMGECVKSFSVEPHAAVNFERVLRSCMPAYDEFAVAPVLEKRLLDEHDYFGDEPDFSRQSCIIYYWSVCKHREWYDAAAGLYTSINNEKVVIKYNTIDL